MICPECHGEMRPERMIKDGKIIILWQCYSCYHEEEEDV